MYLKIFHKTVKALVLIDKERRFHVKMQFRVQI